MRILDNKALIIRTRQPDKYSVIPKHKIISEDDGVYEVAVHWGLDEVRVLKNLGVKDAPSPINRQYKWPGRFTPMAHQIDTASFMTINRRSFCFADPGVGKTASVLWAADYLMVRKEVRRVLIVCPLSIMHAAWMRDISNTIIHRSAIVAHHAQSARRIEMVQGDYEFVIINYDGLNLIAKEINNDGRFDLIIADECFVAGAQVSTPTGKRAIETLKAGDDVFTSNGVMPIQCVIRTTTKRLVNVKTTDGKQITCTPEHPFFTDAGWVTAENLGGRRLVSAPALWHVRHRIQEAEKFAGVGVEEGDKRWDDLLTILRTEEVSRSESRDGLFQPHAAGASGQPNRHSTLGGLQSEHVSITESQRARTEEAWGQRDGDVGYGEASLSMPIGGVGVELPGSVGSEARRLSYLLQARLRMAGEKDWTGGRRRHAQLDAGETAGREEGAQVNGTWVESVTHIKRDSETTVYNLHVEGTPNYFVEDFLVHNCNAYKNPSTNRWKALASIIRPDTYLWLMTGTPAAQSPVDAYGLARLVNPMGVPKFQTAWRDKVMNKISMFKWAPKLGAKDTVFAALQPAIRFTKEQCLDLPPVVTVTREVAMTAQQTKYYKLLKEQLLVQTAGETITAINAGVAVSKLLQISCGAALTDNKEVVEFDCAPRLNVLLELLEETDRKIIIFAMFRSSIATITAFLDKQGIPNAQIHGDVAVGKRHVIINDFQTTDAIRVLVMQPQATAHGITLTAADTVVFYGPLMSVELYVQCIARADRKGQTATKVTVVHIESSPIERKMFRAMNAKVDAHALMVGMFESEIRK